MTLFGNFVLVATAVAGVLAVIMHAWHVRHPALWTPQPVVATRRPEINLASIPVTGDLAGLLFAAGSVLILAGLPRLRWFVALSASCGLMAALAVIVWRRFHPFNPSGHRSLPLPRG
jgi:hypothetical protein